MTAHHAHVVDMAKKNPALLIPVKLSGDTSDPVDHTTVVKLSER